MKSLIRAQVSAAALQSNLARIRAVAPGRRVMAVVKANAYGHGLVPTALCLSSADAFAVARLQEALALRSAGVRAPIVLLEGVIGAEDLAEAAQRNLEIVVHDAAQLDLLEHSRLTHRFVAWIKVDTGMNRLGFRGADFPAALQRLVALGERLQEIRLLTHFACADQREAVMNKAQLLSFAELTHGLSYPRSLANSAAIFAAPGAHGDWIRPGLALYGVSPFPREQGASLGLVPVMRLVSTVISLRDVPAGETVGYGGTWRAARASRIAIVAAGYGDGLPWSLPTGTPVLIGGQRLPLAGRVSMDMIAVDATGAQVAVGDEVVLWGPELPVESLAQAARTIPYELLCSISQRVPLTLC